MKAVTMSIVFICTLVSSSYVFASWFPNVGELNYDGAESANVIMKWEKPELVPLKDTRDQGFELDIVTSKNYFSGCTTFTSLPDGYDDCPTIGPFDSKWATSYGFGTYSLHKIEALVSYTGEWRFNKNSRSASGTLFLNAQASYNAICNMHSPWCRGTFVGRVLVPMHVHDPGKITKIPIKWLQGRTQHLWRLNKNDKY